MTEPAGSNEDEDRDDISVALVKELKRVADKIGQPPTKSQFDNNSTHNPQTYVSEYGSWVEALQAAGLNPRDAQGGRKKATEEELLTELERLAEVLSRPPQVADMNALGDYSAHTYKKRFGSWNAALKEIGLESESTHNVSRDELIEEMKALADKLGYPPRTEHMDSEGKYSSKTYQTRFGGWQKALESAGFKPFSGISKEELLAAVKELAEKLDRAPTTKEFNKETPHSATTCKDKFGSWKKTLENAGLEPSTNGNREYSNGELIDEMKRLDDELGHTPSTSEMEDEGEYSAGVYQNRFGSWGDAVEAAELDVEETGRQKYTYDDLVEEIQRVGDELDSPPRATDMDQMGEISPATFINRFGSWEEALEEAGFNPEENASGKQYTDEELLDEMVQLADKIGRTPTTVEMNESGQYSSSVYVDRFGSWEEAIIEANLDPDKTKESRKYSNQELIAELHRLCDELGKVPTTTDMENYGKYSYATYVSRFGSWEESLEKSGVKTRNITN